MSQLINTLVDDLVKNKRVLKEVPYTQFLAMINQTNVPPGAYTTISEWGIFGHVTKESNVLELASTTGFSLIELSRSFGSSGIGTDICEYSIERANRVAKSSNHQNTNFVVLDALNANQMLAKNKFSHVVIGASLRFIDNQQETPFIQNLVRGIDYDLTFLTCEFFTPNGIPDNLKKDANRVFGINPTDIGYKEVMRPYAHLRKKYEIERILHSETDEELRHYCESTINRFGAEYENLISKALLQECYDRLYEIKAMSNALREYQRYVCLVHEYVPGEFGHRFTELF